MIFRDIAYNLIMGNTTTTLIKTNYKDNQFIVNEIIESKPSIEADVKKKKITISIKGKAAIAEVNYKGNLQKIKTINKIQKDFNNEIEKMIKDSIENVSQKYNSDIYGFRDLFYKTDPKEYKKLKDIWYNDVLQNLKIEVKSEIELIEKGNLNGGIHHE